MMTSNQLRKKFIKFFEERGHKVIPSASLVPDSEYESDKTLFTTAGMQQFKRYYANPSDAPYTNAVSCQKCLRTGDIDEVGDESHLTFFEMLGNFSFGYPDKKESYFKEKAIAYAWEFLTKKLGISEDDITATYYGDEGLALTPDNESKTILLKYLDEDRVREGERFDNFWSLGVEGSPGGRTVEFYINGIEVWNIVFNEAVLRDGKYELTELKGIDTGMGLERLMAVMQSKCDVYETDLFGTQIKKIEELSGKKYQGNEKAMRIIADHIKAATMAISDGVLPSNKDAGYIVRRLIRRAIVKGKQLGIENNFTSDLAEKVFEIYNGIYFNSHSESADSHPRPDRGSKNSGDLLVDSRLRGNDRVDGRVDIRKELDKEEEKFRKTLDKALKKLEIISNMKIGTQWSHGKIDWKNIEIFADDLFDLFQTDGMPLEVSLEEARDMGIIIADKAFQKAEIMRKINEEFDIKLRAHQELSRTASAGMFKGGLADAGEETKKLHTAAHLLLAALREVLGDHITQKGSNITAERLRFDFSHPEKLTDDEKSKIENIVNEIIKKDLPVTVEEMTLLEAKAAGAMGVFEHKYGEKVKVYTIGSSDEVFSREICGGPHVNHTGELGKFRIKKEESSSSGVRRIKAILE